MAQSLTCKAETLISLNLWATLGKPAWSIRQGFSSTHFPFIPLVTYRGCSHRKYQDHRQMSHWRTQRCERHRVHSPLPPPGSETEDLPGSYSQTSPWSKTTNLILVGQDQVGQYLLPSSWLNFCRDSPTLYLLPCGLPAFRLLYGSFF